MSVFLVVTIDTECDKGPGWKLQDPLCFSSVIKGIRERLDDFFNEHQIKATYLLSPEVIQDDTSVTTLAELENCDLGTHLHSEFIPPKEMRGTDRTSRPQFIYPPEIERQKLVNLTDLFEDRFGYRPKSFRAGRFGISRYTLPILAELGYLVDSSVTPFWSHDFDGLGNSNHWGAPLQPYFPDWNKPEQTGKATILEAPVTILNPALQHWPAWLLRNMNNHTRWHARLYYRIKGRNFPKTLWLRPQRSSAVEMIEIAENLISHSRGEPVILNMMYHSVEIMPGASPYAQSETDVQAILGSQATLFRYLRERYSVRSLGLSELYAAFIQKERIHHA